MATMADVADKENVSDLSSYEREIEHFYEVLKKYKIDKDKDKELYDKCENIYSYVIKIIDKLLIKEEYLSELEVSQYTKRNVAYKLISISEDNNFRLYDHFGMNDPNEGKTLLSFLEVEKEEQLPEYLPFISCFSLNANSLNQFRLYGKENNKEATGVCIVFEPSFFIETLGYPLYRCIYIDPDNKQIKSISFSEKEKNKITQEEMTSLFKELKNNVRSLLKSDKNKIELIRDLLAKIRYLVKDYSFAEEQECRIIDIINRYHNTDSIEVDGTRMYIEKLAYIEYDVSKVYFAPLAEGMETFEIKTCVECIRSRHPYKI